VLRVLLVNAAALAALAWTAYSAGALVALRKWCGS
jgi:hypothetical protein